LGLQFVEFSDECFCLGQLQAIRLIVRTAMISNGGTNNLVNKISLPFPLLSASGEKGYRLGIEIIKRKCNVIL
jgi:hypothetical protein